MNGLSIDEKIVFVDYGDFEIIDKNDAENAIEQTKKIFQIVEPLRENLIKEMSKEGSS